MNAEMAKPTCQHCGKPLGLSWARDKEHLDKINPKRLLGPYMDGYFCTRTCGHLWAVQMLKSYCVPQATANDLRPCG